MELLWFTTDKKLSQIVYRTRANKFWDFSVGAEMAENAEFRLYVGWQAK